MHKMVRRDNYRVVTVISRGFSWRISEREEEEEFSRCGKAMVEEIARHCDNVSYSQVECDYVCCHCGAEWEVNGAGKTPVDFNECCDETMKPKLDPTIRGDY